MYDRDLTTTSSSTRTPQQVRWSVALYGVALVILLLIGAWAAPATAAGDAASAPNGGTVVGGGAPSTVR